MTKLLWSTIFTLEDLKAATPADKDLCSFNDLVPMMIERGIPQTKNQRFEYKLLADGGAEIKVFKS